MKLVILHGGYGDLTLTENDVVQSGSLRGLGMREAFERIMTDGYGKGVPATFIAEFKNGETAAFKGKDAASLIDRPDVLEVSVIPQLAGG